MTLNLSDEQLGKLESIAFSRISEYCSVDAGGMHFKPLDQITLDQMAAVKRLELRKSGGKQIQLKNKVAALLLLLEIHFGSVLEEEDIRDLLEELDL